MHRLSLNSLNNDVGSPLVMMSANWYRVGNMLGPPVMNWVLGEVYCRHIVAVDYRGFINNDMEFSKKIAQPGALCSSISNCSVFSFGARSRDRGLPLGRP